jgi:DNA-binding transcriptional ArsR family regulator
MKKIGLEKAILNQANTLEKPIVIEYNALRKALLIIRAINHNERMHILNLLKQREMTVTEIHTLLNSEQSVVSQHLAILRRARIVHGLRNKKFVYYSINKECLDEINRFINILN